MCTKCLEIYLKYITSIKDNTKDFLNVSEEIKSYFENLKEDLREIIDTLNKKIKRDK